MGNINLIQTLRYYFSISANIEVEGFMGCTATSQLGAIQVFLASLHSKLSVRNIVGLFVYFDYLCTFCSWLRSPEEAGEH